MQAAGGAIAQRALLSVREAARGVERQGAHVLWEEGQSWRTFRFS